MIIGKWRSATFATSLQAIPTLSGHQLLILLVQIGTLLMVALLLGMLMRRFGLPALIGELLAGILFGPTILGHLSPGLFGWLLPQNSGQYHLLDAIGQLGVLLLVGLSGIGLNLIGL